MKDQILIYKRALVGSVSLFILAVIASSGEFFGFLVWAIVGGIVSAFFLMPIEKIILTNEIRKIEYTEFAVGTILLIFVYFYLFEDVVDLVVYILEWMVSYNLVALIISFLDRII